MNAGPTDFFIRVLPGLGDTRGRANAVRCLTFLADTGKTITSAWDSPIGGIRRIRTSDLSIISAAL